MLLCDIGNSYAHLYDFKKSWREEIDFFLKKYKNHKIFYISVNNRITPYLKNRNWINLEKYINLNTNYKGMGIDRKAVCLAVEDGVIVDAGSAITVDIMEKKFHKGGFIIPGFKAIENAYMSISDRLKYTIDFNVDINKLPLKTSDAISYGAIKPIVLSIKDVAKNKKIFFTGGDGEKLSKYFDGSIYDENLVFKGMKKALKEIK
ncbi:type III pantothenate kinase [Nitrosophilus kaiyonis]|uniref:type III pantothenate kinase n=1 Tax=Nitrosophilus kaiyonis TaxID=2930200 RepID=UPI002490CDF6|nr:type III pantothenate kinase [Nitrosophilus kaiyonis]